ncbi:MAG: hypothetical protein AAGA92_00785 [Planctomycetota bacterium]
MAEENGVGLPDPIVYASDAEPAVVTSTDLITQSPDGSAYAIQASDAVRAIDASDDASEIAASDHNAGQIDAGDHGQEQLAMTTVETVVPPAPTSDPVPPTPDAAEASSDEGPGTDYVTAEESSDERADEDVLEAISFRGLLPGVSTRTETETQWGPAVTTSADGSQLDYEMDDFRAVRLIFSGDLLENIVVALEEPLTASQLSGALGLTGVRIAEVQDGEGLPAAFIYPERGVVMKLLQDPAFGELPDAVEVNPLAGAFDAQVSAIVIQPIKADGFLLRAQETSLLRPSERIADLEQALLLDPNSTIARLLLSETKLACGQAIEAERLAAEAAEIDPANAAHRLQQARCLRELARYDVAVKLVRGLLEESDVEPIVRAQALYEMGRLASFGPEKLAQQSVGLHNKAIAIADKLATAGSDGVRVAAEQLLAEAHLAIAAEIARGDWSGKNESVAQWVSRASALVEHMIEGNRDHLGERLSVARTSLAAARRLEPLIDPALWVEEAESAAQQIATTTEDEQLLRQTAWDLGMVYFLAAQIEYSRGVPDEAFRLGRLADEKLSAVADTRDELPDTAYVLGELYFHMGAVYAVHFDDHEAACQWYDRAADYLLNPMPVTTIATPSRHGEALVSMGVSFWQTGQQERATELTEAGLRLVENAVEGGLLEPEAVDVPYGNLAFMYGELGRSLPAKRVDVASRSAAGGSQRR